MAESGQEAPWQEEGKRDTGGMAAAVRALARTDGRLPAPVDLLPRQMSRIQLPALSWYNYHLPPKKLKITNTGHTLILSAKWFGERPFLRDGCLVGSYVFSQAHFHWGDSDRAGSENTVDGRSFPMEMHVVHFKSCYLTQEMALKENDGLTILAYFFKDDCRARRAQIQREDNTSLKALVDGIRLVREAHTSARLPPAPMGSFFPLFDQDYYMYWGAVLTAGSAHSILWLVCREPIGISHDQVEEFRSLFDLNDEPLLQNFRSPEATRPRTVFHAVGPAGARPDPAIFDAVVPGQSLSLSRVGPGYSKCGEDGACTGACQTHLK